ncbi:uracil-DNA glycosylase [Gottfriedia acidiceleris]|uniref:Uracil-DNA glycosylase n=1 Tax=Gottfriedia acidiceleris TaxID=371036 RepID=A0ABY4JPP2_9BACI|nr:uracil-DNA glycosylase [Gottfriedia acidiceleris]UPM54290.1 uracil-DNA glycosylase [Gottfriedia acidiceleris]
MLQLSSDWREKLKPEFEKPYFKDLLAFLEKEYSEQTIYPAKEHLFQALNECSYENCKVVIIGQDPYHQPGQAHGLSFSVLPGVKIPPSLRNIYKELNKDLGVEIPTSGYLIKWAKQGILLLNTVLTVREGEPNSHKNKGWELFTNTILSELNKQDRPIIFVLWGKHAQAKEELITSNHHVILKSNHPSPLSASRGFFGSKPFSQINQKLVELQLEPIDWTVE